MSKRVGNNKNILTVVIILLTVILAIFIVSGIIFFNIQMKNKEMLNNPNIYNNIFIEKVNVSNMSKEDAKKALESIKLNETITLTYEDKQYNFSKEELGVSLAKEDALSIAYEIGRKGTEKERLQTIKSLEEQNQVISVDKNINEETAKAKVEEVAKDINLAPKNATSRIVAMSFCEPRS